MYLLEQRIGMQELHKHGIGKQIVSVYKHLLCLEVNVFLVKSLHFARLLSSVIGGAEETRRLDSRS